jgi:DNA-binding CsgD family transcriptional regulator
MYNSAFERTVQHVRSSYAQTLMPPVHDLLLQPCDTDTDTVARLRSIGRVRSGIRGAASVGELFARTALAACAQCGFERGVVVTVEDGVLAAGGSDAIGDEGSDRLRRALLAAPVTLTAGTHEHAVIRRADAPQRTRRPLPSPLAATLGLDDFAFAAIVPEARTLALLVVDRSGRSISPVDEAVVEVVASFAALELAAIVQRARVGDLVAEVRNFAAASVVLARESTEAPVVLPRDHGLGPTFSVADAALAVSPQAVQVLSGRELRVASLLAEGRSNREIAEQLTISTETVKSHVGRILRKLDAGNRAEAVSRLLRTDSGPGS